MSSSLIKVAAVIATVALSVAVPAGTGDDPKVEPTGGFVSSAVAAEADVVTATENPELHNYQLMLAGLAAVAFMAVRRRQI
jgi:hypothetical protein